MSSAGTHHAPAHAVAEGARGAGAEVCVRLVVETAPAWQVLVERSADQPRTALTQLERAHAVAFGSQFASLLAGACGLWVGKLADDAGLTAAQDPHRGQESTLALDDSIDQLGGHIVAPPAPAGFVAGAACGVSVTADGGGPGEADLAHARVLARRGAEVAQELAG